MVKYAKMNQNCAVFFVILMFGYAVFFRKIIIGYINKHGSFNHHDGSYIYRNIYRMLSNGKMNTNMDLKEGKYYQFVPIILRPSCYS